MYWAYCVDRIWISGFLSLESNYDHPAWDQWPMLVIITPYVDKAATMARNESVLQTERHMILVGLSE